MSRYIDDTIFLMEQLEKNHIALYFRASKQEVHDFIDREIINAHIKNDAEYHYKLRVLFKLLGDDHTSVMLPNGKCFFFPFETKNIDDSIIISEVYKEEYTQYLGCEITHINGLPIKNVLMELEKITIYGPLGWLRFMQSLDIVNASNLAFLPIFKNNNNDWTLSILLNGKQSVIKCETVNGAEIGTSIPKPPENMSFKVFDETVHIIYCRCHEKFENQMQNMIEQIKQEMKQTTIKNIIVDIRGNTGGRSSIIEPLIEFLKTSGLNIITLIDSGVFSSGIMAAMDLKNIGSTLIGDDVGEDQNSFGESERFELPNTKFRVKYSTKYFYCDRETNHIAFIDDRKKFEEFCANPNNKKYFTPYILQPNIYAKSSVEEYLFGIDKPLETAIETFKRINEEIKRM